MGGGPDDCRPCLRRRWTLRFQQQLCRPVVSRGSLAGLFCCLTWSAGTPCVAAGPEVIGGDGSDPSHEESFQRGQRSEEHTSELQSLMRSSYAVFCLKKKKHTP